MVLQHLNVKFIATGVNNFLTFLGSSHCCGSDDKKIMEMIGLKVFDPYSQHASFENIVREWIADTSAGCIRV